MWFTSFNCISFNSNLLYTKPVKVRRSEIGAAHAQLTGNFSSQCFGQNLNRAAPTYDT
jgi:hypothetical protein